MNSKDFKYSSTEHLLKEIAGGNTHAEQTLISKYWRGLYFVLTKRTNDPDLASDLAQDAFVVIITNAREGKIENAAGFNNYVRQVGINLMIAHYRKEKRQSTDGLADIDTVIPDDSPDIYRQLYSANMLELVQNLMDELSTERDREILTQYFVYEKDKSDICRKMELKPEHFDRVLYRAKNRLLSLVQSKLEINTDGKLSADTLKLMTLTVFLVTQLVPLPDTPKEIESGVRESVISRHFL